MQKHRIVSGGALTALAIAGGTRAVEFGKPDTFTDGTTMGWMQGGNTPVPTSNIASGGPAGALDAYVENRSSGVGGAGSKQIFFNQSQWAGSFVNAHVTRVQGDMANFGSTTLYMRIALRGADGNVAASTHPVILPANSGWQRVSFDLTYTGMTAIFGGTISGVEANVFETRLLSSQFGGTVNGDNISSILGVDNLVGLTLPGDVNFDNTVNTSDFTALAAHFNESNQTWDHGDLNLDKTVNALDFNSLAANFGRTITLDPPSAPTLVPEPGGLAVLGMIAGLSRNRRERIIVDDG